MSYRDCLANHQYRTIRHAGLLIFYFHSAASNTKSGPGPQPIRFLGPAHYLNLAQPTAGIGSGAQTKRAVRLRPMNRGGVEDGGPARPRTVRGPPACAIVGRSRAMLGTGIFLVASRSRSIAMWWIVLVVLLMVFGNITFVRYLGGDLFERTMLTILWWFVGGIVAIPLTILLLKSTGGMGPDYGAGSIEGYVTAVCEDKGLVWKTTEINLQAGAREGESLQCPIKCSIPRERDDLLQTAKHSMGRRVRVRVRVWVAMPFRIGESDLEVTAIDVQP